MGKQRKYIYIHIFFFSYFGMFFDYIHDLDFFLVCYLLGAWCLGGEKMWERKGNIYIFLFWYVF